MKRAKSSGLATSYGAQPAVELAGPARLVQSELLAAEARMSRLLDSNEDLIAEICHYLIDGAGKRLRPAFIMLVYRACGGNDARVDDAIDAAIALELIHSATLLHDDIVDGGMLRRGKPSAFARYGSGATLIAGDYLFSRAFELCGRFEEHLVHTAAHACLALTEGEVMEGRLRHNNAGVADYLGVIERKTASLFRAGGQVAADLAGAPSTTIDAMARLGNAIGLAFQMVDDLLDVLGPEEKIGKPVGSDLRAGIPSLPIVLGLERSAEFRRLYRNGARFEGVGLKRALRLLRAPALVKKARAMAAEQVAAARNLLDLLVSSPYRDGLRVLIDEQIDREV